MNKKTIIASSLVALMSVTAHASDLDSFSSTGDAPYSSPDSDQVTQSADQSLQLPQNKAESNPSQSLLDMKGSPGEVDQESDVKNARGKAVYEAAETYAAQTSYCQRSNELKSWADSRATLLDASFNFTNLLMDGGRVIPPVIEQVDASYKQQGDDTAITAQTSWHILEPAKIVSTAPNWRSYLYVSCAKPLKPNPILMPGALKKTETEDKALWIKGVKAGWSLGRQQADSAFNLGLNRMTRDYIGMLRFYSLNRRGIVSTPILARGNVGIRVEGQDLSVGETLFRLTGNATWNTPSDWKPKIDNKVAQ